MRKAMLKAIQEAVRREGSKTAVAKKLGVARQALTHWDTDDGKHRVPAHHVLGMEAMSGVSRYELRPDIYGPPPAEVKLRGGNPNRTGVRVAA